MNDWNDPFDFGPSSGFTRRPRPFRARTLPGAIIGAVLLLMVFAALKGLVGDASPGMPSAPSGALGDEIVITTTSDDPAALDRMTDEALQRAAESSFGVGP
jgi:hypothetical protein